MKLFEDNEFWNFGFEIEHFSSTTTISYSEHTKKSCRPCPLVPIHICNPCCFYPCLSYHPNSIFSSSRNNGFLRFVMPFGKINSWFVLQYFVIFICHPNVYLIFHFFASVIIFISFCHDGFILCCQWKKNTSKHDFKSKPHDKKRTSIRVCEWSLCLLSIDFFCLSLI